MLLLLTSEELFLRFKNFIKANASSLIVSIFVAILIWQIGSIVYRIVTDPHGKNVDIWAGDTSLGDKIKLFFCSLFLMSLVSAPLIHRIDERRYYPEQYNNEAMAEKYNADSASIGGYHYRGPKTEQLVRRESWFLFFSLESEHKVEWTYWKLDESPAQNFDDLEAQDREKLFDDHYGGRYVITK